MVVVLRESCPALPACCSPAQDLRTTPQEPSSVDKQTLISRDNVTKPDHTDSFLQVKCSKEF